MVDHALWTLKTRAIICWPCSILTKHNYLGVVVIKKRRYTFCLHLVQCSSVYLYKEIIGIGAYPESLPTQYYLRHQQRVGQARLKSDCVYNRTYISKASFFFRFVCLYFFPFNISFFSYFYKVGFVSFLFIFHVFYSNASHGLHL